VVYASGIRPPPNRRRSIHQPESNTCVFIPEIFSNMLVPGVTYTWQVYVFTPTEAANNSDIPGPQHGMNRDGVTINPAHSSAPENFQVADFGSVCAPCEMPGPAGSFNLGLDIGFFTPNTGARTVYVEAFKNAAFSGKPVARTITSIPATRPAIQNVTIYGLDSKMDYYVRAYVRANTNDGIDLRKPYDPWGYVCAPPMGDWRYDPLRIEDPMHAYPDPYWLPMYATDINNNREADINEIDKLTSYGFMSFMSNIQAPALLGVLKGWNGDLTDTTGSGLPDSYEEFMGLGNHSRKKGASAKLLGELGVQSNDDLRLVIGNMPKTADGKFSVEWALETNVPSTPGKPGGFKALSESGVTIILGTEVMYALERTDSLSNPDWVVEQWIESNSTGGGFTFDINPKKSSGFYRVKMVEFPE